jgi:hypothetical protein
MEGGRRERRKSDSREREEKRNRREEERTRVGASCFRDDASSCLRGNATDD